MMKANDIAVNLNTLNLGSCMLGKKIDEIEQLAEQLRRNMNIAGKEFDSVNFERAEQVMQEVISKLRQTMEYLKDGCNFLNELEERAEIYLKCRYIG